MDLHLALPADRRGRAAFAVAVAAIWSAGLVALGLVDVDSDARPRLRPRGPHVAIARAAPRRVVIGHSVRGRPLVATVLGDPRARVAALVVGCIHGNEPAGIRVTRRLRSLGPVPGVALWVLDDLNPDGVASDTRQNARGVDLNRNFPYGWRQLGRPGYQQYSGLRPLSEPESRAAHRLILRVRPRVTIWFHQPLGVVDESGGDVRVERRFARLSGLPLRRLARYPGSVSTWQDHRFAGTTAFVVELPSGRPPARRVARWALAVRTLAREAGSGRPR